METDNKRPNAALINREWYESAREILTREELGSAVLNAIAYVLYGDELPPSTSKVGIVCRMIKPALDSDIAKYLERCARNAANAKSQRQRVGASGSDSQRVGANTTPTSTPTTTPTSTSTTSLSAERSEEIERWLIFGYFWSTGSKAIKEELNAFWSYYESLGWKNGKGAAIVNKLAAARMWRRQFETGTAPNGSEGWFKALQTCTIPDCNAFLAFLGAERKESEVVVRLRCNKSFYESMRAAVPDLEPTLRRIWRTPLLSIETAG
ncbi:hypothetical protein IJF85_01915 [Candidatus Saccharibacteria bacterium]|nr:hypothetical protein [Candidatus Saccharibacteria bacterium]